MKENSWTVIINPVSGGGRGRQSWARLSEDLRARGIRFKQVLTEAPGHGAEVAQAASGDGVPVVLSLGGDGTAGEIAAALAGSGTALGVLPGGTGNDFIRGLGLPLDPLRALAALLEGTEIRADLGTINGRPFLNAAGAGFDAEVARRVRQAQTCLPGPSAYLKGVFSAIRDSQPVILDLVIDGAPPRRLKCWLIAAANGRCYGGGMWIAPRASLTDGRLDLCVVAQTGKASFLGSLPLVFMGRHELHPAVSIITARKVRIRSEGGRPVPVHADGEPLGELPVEFSVLPGALRLLVPGRR